MRPVLSLIAGIAVSAAALASNDTRPDTAAEPRSRANECTFFRSVSDFKALDRTKLVIWAPGRRNAYLVELSMPLLDLKFANQLGFVDSNGDGRLCGYGMDKIVTGDSSFPQNSTILGMTRLDEAQLLELEQQYHVKLVRKPRSLEPKPSAAT